MKFCFVYLFLFSGLWTCLLVGGSEIEQLKPRLIETGKILLQRAEMVFHKMTFNREPLVERIAIRKEAAKIVHLMAQLEEATQDRSNFIWTLFKLSKVECDLNKRLKHYVAQTQKNNFLKNVLL